MMALRAHARGGPGRRVRRRPGQRAGRQARSISHTQTATLPLAALTAWQALVDYAAAEPGERVLVHGGAGGVGAFTVQAAAGSGRRRVSGA
jgi:NADPH:quinone reductase-like Zn-dependent oxidoreductase